MEYLTTPGQMPEFTPTDSYIRVATACPEVAVGDIAANVNAIARLYDEACADDASLVVFPELSLTGYTLGDLVQQKTILNGARDGLTALARYTAERPAAMVVGLPLARGNAIYNVAAVLSDGIIRGFVPKTNLPTYKEFYEKRWFQAWDGGNTTVRVGDHDVPFGTDLLFTIGDATMGVEICEDLWVMQSPSIKLAQAGANIIANPSASPELAGKSTYRRELVAGASARLVLAYLYAGCDRSESTMDIVMGGHQLIAENGSTLAERPALTIGQRLTVADIDLDHLTNDRRRDTNTATLAATLIDCGITPSQTDIRRSFDPHPFVPTGPEKAERLQNIIDIQAAGLATRLEKTGITTVLLGLSGGLDSTLALLVAARAARMLGCEPGDIIRTITMPGEASSEATQSNAVKLAAALGIPNEIIPINTLSTQQMRALGHDGSTQDTTYENVQARMRTSLLFNRANQSGGLVLGTGDLSEIALGWCTYNGDHMSHYNVNASVPKTLVRHLVAHAAGLPGFEAATAILDDILDTPVSPELTTAGDGGISQKTEELIGPYELHDFYLYHFIRWNDTPDKIAAIAGQAFAGSYSPEEIDHWLDVFLTRFYANQWKRSVATDGPKVGSVALSPRGDWRMPSDITNPHHARKETRHAYHKLLHQ